MQSVKLLEYFTKEEINKLLSINDLFVRSLAIIGRIYEERLDKSGNQESGHFIRVSNMGRCDDERVTGILHDVVEDGFLTFNDLKFLGFPKHIIDALKILCRDKKVFPVYADYITNVINSNNYLAIYIKYADMLDNSNPIRLSKLDDDTKMRLINKYVLQLPRLKNKLIELESKDMVLERKCV